MSARAPGLPTPPVIEAYRQVLSQWPVPCQQQHVRTRAGATFVVSCGPREAPPLVLLHGTLSNAASWMFDAAHWSTHYRVHAIDLIGEPGLSAPTHPLLDSDGHAQWLGDVLDALGIDAAAFVGLSFGGYLALDLALRQPQRVQALALLSPSGLGRQRAFLLKALPLLLLGHWGRRRLRTRVMGPQSTPPPEQARPLLALLDLIHAQVRPRHLRIPRIDDARLATLRPPLRMIIGGRDALIDAHDAAERTRRLLPTAEVTLLPEAFHYIPGQRDTLLHWLLSQRSPCHA
ncbi:alpha/beta fold hydrolase [Stenotrophomonas sp. 24(2023)]|uniref:alpha/beta fold hydrolase n=1 Tax=Stenotrophomonas sp. 24(2023) TaxID=3068324 RepID=UPI0027DFD1A2|nr:alpha/beta fold hydrolase [Stenotrophomonas sp. 24(2023)]WMJ68925.1 alpha/beta fold hydrolase [Stenotrophomonas sp. 24(2023)]